ncbi:enoyl-CoA hydratase-related protein [Streptomyces sp. NK15101]|uniref:enoyl-CoA hydratase-related protein n=1 Tax=Streptomyces sp. NK15101 TaxID=2873261 RepID=UPI001CEDCDC1|nr:enoyl-CoA hydratase-related protein [Streptomyces sp. NK15101]
MTSPGVPKPVIVVVNNLAYEGGCEITETAPLGIAAEHAAFAEPEVSLGVPPPFGGSRRLPRRVGRKRGLEMILTGDPVPAARAAEIGLVNGVVPAGELLGAAREPAAHITRHAPTAVAACLRAVTRGIDLPIDEGLAVESARFAATVPAEGVRTGPRRFLDRQVLWSDSRFSALPPTAASPPRAGRRPGRGRVGR